MRVVLIRISWKWRLHGTPYERFKIHKRPAGHRMHTSLIKECVWGEGGSWIFYYGQLAFSHKQSYKRFGSI